MIIILINIIIIFSAYSAMSQDSICSPEALYRDHHDWLFGWLRRRLGCEFDAADLTQDTYLRIMVSGRLPRPEQSRPFLIQVAKGLAIDLHRRRALERAYLESLASLPAGHAPSAERQQLVLEALVEIDKALDALPARVREAFLLSRFERLTYAAIAGRMGVSVAAVRKYMFKAATACMATLEGISVEAALA